LRHLELSITLGLLLTGCDSNFAEPPAGLTRCYRSGAKVFATHTDELRAYPGKSFPSLETVRADTRMTVATACPNAGWYRVSLGGMTGWFRSANLMRHKDRNPSKVTSLRRKTGSAVAYAKPPRRTRGAEL
jgi:uncharacterized protein YraI